MKIILSGLAILFFTACGGGGSSSSSAPVVDTDVSGVWFGKYNSNSGVSYDAMALISPNNEIRLAIYDSVTITHPIHADGILKINGNNIDGILDLYYDLDGDGIGDLDPSEPTVTFSAVDDGQLSGTYTTSKDSGTFSLSYLNSSDEAASLSKIAGTYFSSTAIDYIDIDSNGVISSSSSSSSTCGYAGQINVLDPALNVYDISFAISCGGSTISMKGLATYNYDYTSLTYQSSNGSQSIVDYMSK